MSYDLVETALISIENSFLPHNISTFEPDFVLFNSTAEEFKLAANSTPELNFKNLDIAHNLCAKVTYDIGSGSTKIMGALWNTQCDKIEAVFAEYEFPMGYSYDLAKSSDNQFSDLIMDMGLNKLKEYQTKVHEDFANLNLDLKPKEYGVATAAFRNAGNGQTFCEQLAQMLDIDLKVITQDEEGELGYLGAISVKNAENPIEFNFNASPVVWDIGGGSLQVTHQDIDGAFNILKGNLGSGSFQGLLENYLSVDIDLSTEQNLEQAITIAKENLKLDQNLELKFKNIIQENKQVIGIGSVHNLSIQKMINKINEYDHNYYTKEDVLLTAKKLGALSNEGLKEFTGMTDDNLLKCQVPNLVLVYAIMDELQIEKVEVVKANNSKGLMKKGAYSK